MGREIRKVPPYWKHPKDKNGNYIPLLGEKFSEKREEYKERKKKWEEGFYYCYVKHKYVKKSKSIDKFTFEEWAGEPPRKKDYMPEFNDSEKTHIQLYQTTSEGTPLTPIFKMEDFEKLCEYAAKKCYSFADFRETKKGWINMLKGDLQ